MAARQPPFGRLQAGWLAWKDRLVLREMRLALATLLVGLLPATVLGAPTVRVRGAAQVEATATVESGELFVAGEVRDDTGRPVGSASLVVGAFSRSEATLPITSARPCPGDDAPTRFARPEGGLRLTTDRSGRFCLVVEAENADVVSLGFTDERGLFDAVERRLRVERGRRRVSLRFVDPPTALAIEQPTQRVAVAADLESLARGAPPATIAVALYARVPAKQSSPPTLLAQSALETGRRTTLEFSSSKLPEPGPVELSVRFGGSDELQPAEARVRLAVSARVGLALGRQPDPGDPREGIDLEVGVATGLGAVTSGAVEATLAGRTVGIAKVDHGNAAVKVRFPRRGSNPNVEIRYLPGEPWLLPGAPLSVAVPVAPRGPLGTAAWLVVLTLVGFYVVRGWRRPRATPRAGPLPELRGPPSAAVVVVEGDRTLHGWRGSVRDAHDGAPIGGAVIELLETSREQMPIARAQADESGHFELRPPGDEKTLLLAVRAPFHADLLVPAPEFGVVRVDLLTRRRHVLGRLVRWASGRPAFGGRRGEPTPAEVQRAAHAVQKGKVADWARTVEAAAYGPVALDEHGERDVLAREPVEQVEQADAPNRTR